jgi:serine/threonine protein kinase
VQLRMLTCSRDTQVDKDFNVKIADFGLARLKAHVMTGNLGTCQYMAPGNIYPPSLYRGRGPRGVTYVYRVLNLSPVRW